MLAEKLQSDVPNLLSDTWFLQVETMRGTDLIVTKKSTTVRCEQGQAYINPEYELQRVEDLEPGEGIRVEKFADSYEELHKENDVEMSLVERWESDEKIGRGRRKDSWLVRGLQVAIVPPTGEQ